MTKWLGQGAPKCVSCWLGDSTGRQRLWSWLVLRHTATATLIAIAGLLALGTLVLVPGLVGPGHAEAKEQASVSCLEIAVQLKHSVAFVRQLQHRSRALPSTAAGTLRLAASNWPGGQANESDAGESQGGRKVCQGD